MYVYTNDIRFKQLLFKSLKGIMLFMSVIYFYCLQLTHNGKMVKWHFLHSLHSNLNHTSIYIQVSESDLYGPLVSTF